MSEHGGVRSCPSLAQLGGWLGGWLLRAAALLGLSSLLLSGCARESVYQQESFVFGTRVEVIIAGVDEAVAVAAADAVLREFDRLHRTYHAWQPSELSALNAALAAGQSVSVSPEMAGFIADAQQRSAVGEGLFDPGIGRLIHLWGFQADEFVATLPDAAALAAWRAERPGIAEVVLKEGRVSSRSRGVALDFGGYLKGVALDRGAAILRAHGVNNALINIGGNVMALGDRYGRAWRVGIQHPRKPGPMATLALADGEAIGTSGDYQRYFELNGRRYCHLLDPRTGEPASATEAVTIVIPRVADAGTRSDASSKPLFVAGAADWPRLAKKMGIDEVLRVDGAGHVQVTAALNRRLTWVGDAPADLEVSP
ncbi:FAD:protein FMN transferase [Rhodocyclus tenuis]|uniref:FAD:protein FMN transferase n=1 Tax=Rhodocyclus gracilis TaxID=2929842 RepID=A0ABX0WHV8_9RHOO|nr:FAD:protein FMN transferase [Rhodocyclus gracilis]NJA88441.1 FAD:protein FMN transferase [Rhodocyclus gracilis]